MHEIEMKENEMEELTEFSAIIEKQLTCLENQLKDPFLQMPEEILVPTPEDFGEGQQLNWIVETLKNQSVLIQVCLFVFLFVYEF